MLASLASNAWNKGNASDNAPIFIDRNGRLFEYVLDYLRAGEVYMPSSVSPEAVKKEFAFYGIDVDASKVHHTCVTEYFDLFIEKVDARRIDKIATFVEREFLKLPFYSVELPLAEYVHLCHHEDLLRARLLERGLKLVRHSWGA